MKSIVGVSNLSQIKQLLRRYTPLALINLYETYKYNLSTVLEQHPLSLIQNVLTTTRKLSNNRKTILFYPDFPYMQATIYQVCLLLGYEVTNNPVKNFDVAIKWKRYATFAPNDNILSHLSAQNISVVNINCEDVSKLNVDKIFHLVFGYSTAVDPLTYTGKCVVKSNLNAQHDGKIISCPISKIEPDVFYQKLIDNEVEDGQVLDMRVPVFKNVIPFVYLYLKKNLTEEQRFFGYPSLISVRLAEAHEVFEEDEVRKIIWFCQKIGLDYGELDVLRDNNDKQLYIIDANNTPSSRLLFEPLRIPRKKCILPPIDRLIALNKLTQAFQEKLLRLN